MIHENLKLEVHNYIISQMTVVEKMHSLKQTRKGYCSELTKTVNRINIIILKNHSPEKNKSL